MVEPTSPIDSDVSIPTEQDVGGVDGAPTGELAKLIKPGKTWTVSILPHIKLTFLSACYETTPVLLASKHVIVGLHEVPVHYILAHKIGEVVDIVRVMEPQ